MNRMHWVAMRFQIRCVGVVQPLLIWRRRESPRKRVGIFQPMREEAQPTSHGTARHRPPRAEFRQEATARACGPWSRLTIAAPRTQVRRSAATHPAEACCAGIYIPRLMARRLRLLTHGLKIAHPLRGLPIPVMIRKNYLISAKTVLCEGRPTRKFFCQGGTSSDRTACTLFL